MPECAICLDAEAVPCIVGCDHRFCVDCITRWCTQRAAFCPTCRAPIYHIERLNDDRLFVPPHYGRYGVHLNTHFKQIVVARVEQGTIAASLGVTVGAVMDFDGHTDLDSALDHLRSCLRSNRASLWRTLQSTATTTSLSRCLYRLQVNIPA